MHKYTFCFTTLFAKTRLRSYLFIFNIALLALLLSSVGWSDVRCRFSHSGSPLTSGLDYIIKNSSEIADFVDQTACSQPSLRETLSKKALAWAIESYAASVENNVKDINKKIEKREKKLFKNDTDGKMVLLEKPSAWERTKAIAAQAVGKKINKSIHEKIETYLKDPIKALPLLQHLIGAAVQNPEMESKLQPALKRSIWLYGLTPAQRHEMLPHMLQQNDSDLKFYAQSVDIELGHYTEEMAPYFAMLSPKRNPELALWIEKTKSLRHLKPEIPQTAEAARDQMKAQTNAIINAYCEKTKKK